MSLSVTELSKLLQQYQQQLTKAQANVQQLIGAIGCVQNQLRIATEKQKEEANAIEEREKPESNSA